MSSTTTETSSKSPAQLKALNDALNKIESDFGTGAIMDMSGPVAKINRIPFGVLPLDIALGIGGAPEGRILEIFGPESSGKTTLMYHLMASCQAEGGVAAFIDVEHSMDALYARRLGVNIDDLIVSQPDFGEQALQIAQVLVESGAVQLIVIDSVAALTPKAEIEGQVGDSSIGLQARMMSQACRILASKCNKSGTTLAFTNQIREKVGVMFGSPETQPGGRALKFYASQRLDIRRIETIKEGTEAVGNRVRVKVVKNKVAPPFKQAEFVITFGVGVNREMTVIEMQVAEKNLENPGVTKAGSFYTFTATGEKLQGLAKANVYLKDHPEITDALEAQLKHLYLDEGGDINDSVSDVVPEAVEAVEEPAAKAASKAAVPAEEAEAVETPAKDK